MSHTCAPLISQILVLFDSLEVLDRDAIGQFVSSLQQDDGSFWGDEWGEVDTRFSFCSLATLSLLGLLERMCWYLLLSIYLKESGGRRLYWRWTGASV